MQMEYSIPLDVWNLIFHSLNIFDQLSIRGTCRYFFRNLKIIDLYYVPPFLSRNFNQKILDKFPDTEKLRCLSPLSLIKFTKLKKLRIDFMNEDHLILRTLTCLGSLQVSNMCYITNLQEYSRLHTLKYQYIGTTDLSPLIHLTNLQVGNEDLKDINYLTNLKKLKLVLNSGLTNEGIRNLTNITSLRIEDNVRIWDINHMTKLKKLLEIYKGCLKDASIRHLTNLVELRIQNHNKKVKTISHLTRLQILHIAPTIDINQLLYLKNLTELSFGYSELSYKVNLNALTNLRKLSTNYLSIFDNESISRLTNLLFLSIEWGHSPIDNFNTLCLLTKLELSYDSKIHNRSITNLTNLLQLSLCYGHSNLHDINKLTNITSLSLTNNRGLTNDGIKNLTNLLYLDIEDCGQITNLRYFTKLNELIGNIYNDDASHLVNLTFLQNNSYYKPETIASLKRLKFHLPRHK